MRPKEPKLDKLKTIEGLGAGARQFSKSKTFIPAYLLKTSIEPVLTDFDMLPC
ncbi:hypothetical protein M3226_04495 [Neobacillus cucumis]|uniref:hypothetical protein n=1 Tax=Neobacillus cucumis TaxID=1740721 RepID=UPI00203CEB3A|nr:hypothetical protein [Neobacillus cucumis]MCM3724958.1 hypothetical protein [Neobacillus cucumis]